MLGCFGVESHLHLAQLFWHLRSQVIGLREILIDVVELPLGRQHINVSTDSTPRQTEWRGRSEPSVVIDAGVAKDLEILCLAAIFGFGVVERVNHAGPFDGVLVRAIDFDWLRQVCGFENRRNDVDHVVEL